MKSKLHEWYKKIEKLNLDEDMKVEQQNWLAYKETGGMRDEKTFQKNLRVFLHLTLKAYTGGTEFPYELDREESWDAFVQYIGSLEEADRFFVAVDAICPYT